jgi:choline monooxygenase
MYVDNYMEGYHIPFIHPGLAQSLSTTVYTYRLGEYTNEQYGAEPHPRGPGSRVAGILGGTQEFRALKPPLPGLADSERSGYYFHWVFPLATINFMPDGILFFQIRPIEPELTESTFHWFLPPARDFRDRLLQGALVNFGHLVNTEDYEICQIAQRGMHSSVYRQGRYSPEQEACLHHFHRLLADQMRPHLAAWDSGRAGMATS